MISAIVAALALSQTPFCAAPAGAEQLWARPETRFVFVGELHGTVEAPAAFAELVCAASADRPVVVALEITETMQPDLDAWLGSDGGEAARQTLLAHDYWIRANADGRSSEAMRDMLFRLQALKTAGRDLSIRAFMPSERRPADFDQSYYEIDMARLLVDAAASRPEALVLALGGNLHNRKTMFDDVDAYLFAAGHLKPSVVVSLNVAQQGGQSWSCMGSPSGETICDASDSRAVMDPEIRGVILEPQDDGAWDGLLALGPWTASPPAREE